MVEDHFAGRLDVSQYPYVRDGPPGSSADAVGGSSSSSSSSSHTFTPEDFVDSLRKFGKSGAGGHAVPGSGAIGAPPQSQGYDPRSGHPPPHQQYQGQGHGAPPHQAGYAGYNGGYGDGYGGGGYQQQQAPPPPLQPAPPPVNQRTYDRRFGGGVAAPVPVRDSEPALDSRWSAGPPGQGQGLGQSHAQPQQHNQQQQQQQQQHAYESHRP
ncbi:hypothetical protein CF336_g9309, partial [Tilletia laevis]